MTMPQTANSGFDTAVMDKDNHAIALVQVKDHPVQDWTIVLPTRMTAPMERIDFLLAVDPSHISLFRPVGENIKEPVVRLDTQPVLERYDPEIQKKRVYKPYLLTLVEAWLRDLAYHWKSEFPPGVEELTPSGLLERIEGGTTQRPGD